MICCSCKNRVSDGLFCSICGWDQRKAPDQCTLLALHGRWKKRKHYRSLGPKGKSGYDLAWKKLETLARRPIQTITFDEYQTVLDEMAASGLALSTQQKVQQLISQLCKLAISESLLAQNIASELALEGRQARATQPFDLGHIPLLLDYAKSGRYAQAAQITLVLIFTGFRPEELFSIRCEDIDPQVPFLCSGSKTEAGKNRIVPILPLVQPYIARWYLSCPIRDHRKQGFLIRGAKGGRKNLANWRAREFYPMTLELGINRPDQLNDKRKFPHITPYSARHSFATWSAKAGVEEKALTKMIGHADIKTTEKFYIHAELLELPTAKKIQREAMKIENYIKAQLAI